MVGASQFRLLHFVRGFPADLVAVLGATALVNLVVLTPVVRETPLRVPVGLAFLLFVPGYAVIAALFPERERPDGAETEPRQGTGLAVSADLDTIDRLSLSVVTSAAVVPLVGLAMNFTPWGIRLVPTLIAVSLVTVALVVFAARRREGVAPSKRFRVPVRSWIRTRSATVRRPESTTSLLLNVLLIVSVLLAAVSVGYAIAGPNIDYGPTSETGSNDGYSAISLLGEDDELITNETEFDGDGVTGPEQFRIGIDNHEQRTVTYTVVAAEQVVEPNGDELTVREQRVLDRFTVTVDENDSTAVDHEVEPLSDDADRIVWLLYPDDVPTDPSPDSAEAYVAITLTEAD